MGLRVRRYGPRMTRVDATPWGTMVVRRRAKRPNAHSASAIPSPVTTIAGQPKPRGTETLRTQAATDGSIGGHLDADEVARFLINSWEGAVIRMKIANSRQPLDDFFAVAFPLFIGSGASSASSPTHRTAPPARHRKRAARRSSAG
jgi:Tetracyclin repressor-like, C-terminal domain